MNGWFLAMITIYILNIGISLAKHGEEKKGEYNFFSQLLGAVIGIFIIYMAVKTGF